MQFYLAYLEHIAPFRASGLAFSYPRVSGRSKDVHGHRRRSISRWPQTQLIGQRRVVTNDFRLTERGAILVVTGPTTAARRPSRGPSATALPRRPRPAVAGEEVQLFFADRCSPTSSARTTYETLRGKFEDELFRSTRSSRTRPATACSIMNESFGSTTLRDALTVGSGGRATIIDLDALCVFVTFVDELASARPTHGQHDEHVVPDDPPMRPTRWCASAPTA